MLNIAIVQQGIIILGESIKVLRLYSISHPLSHLIKSQLNGIVINFIYLQHVSNKHEAQWVFSLTSRKFIL